jgi:hypothetical protein
MQRYVTDRQALLNAGFPDLSIYVLWEEIPVEHGKPKKVTAPAGAQSNPKLWHTNFRNQRLYRHHGCRKRAYLH